MDDEEDSMNVPEIENFAVGLEGEEPEEKQ
jgi:hypothetical protein